MPRIDIHFPTASRALCHIFSELKLFWLVLPQIFSKNKVHDFSMAERERERSCKSFSGSSFFLSLSMAPQGVPSSSSPSFSSSSSSSSSSFSVFSLVGFFWGVGGETEEFLQEREIGGGERNCWEEFGLVGPFSRFLDLFSVMEELVVLALFSNKNGVVHCLILSQTKLKKYRKCFFFFCYTQEKKKMPTIAFAFWGGKKCLCCLY